MSTTINPLDSIEKRFDRAFNVNRTNLAYGKLQGKCENSPFSAYLSKLPACLGRSDSLPSPHTPKSMLKLNVGQIKSVSRHHAIISWDDTHSSLSLQCIGKNGMIVKGLLVVEGEKVLLSSSSSTPIRFGRLEIYFLPPILPDLPIGIEKPISLVTYAFQGKGTKSIEEAVQFIIRHHGCYIEAMGGEGNVRKLVK